MFEKGNLSRRGFLSRALAGLTAGAGLPSWYASELLAAEQERQAVRQPGGPNDNIVLGAIGTGTNHARRAMGQPIRGERGVAILDGALGQRMVRCLAVCDVDSTSREFARDRVNTRARNQDCTAVEDFRRVLENRDINAVLIGTPDHWHAIIAAAAMRAGKHVYCEKPLTLTVDEGKALVRIARQTRRVLQTGSQQRTEFSGRFRLAAELVRNGRIGRIQRIETIIGRNPRGGPFPTPAVQKGLNWDFWQGQTPQVPYALQRCYYEFRWWYEYSGGKMTDWGAHHNDTAQWALGMDDSGPVRVEAGRCAAPDARANCYNTHPDFEVTYTYNNGPNGAAGTRLVCRSARSRVSIPGGNEEGILFEGEDNKWIYVSRGRVIGGRGDQQDAQIVNEPLGQNATRLGRETNHMVDFLDCARGAERQPAAGVGIGHRSVSVCHIGNIAIRLGRALTWDPSQERFTGEGADEGNRMLSRPMRAPWDAYWRQQVGDA